MNYRIYVLKLVEEILTAFVKFEVLSSTFPHLRRCNAADDGTTSLTMLVLLIFRPIYAGLAQRAYTFS